jgi:glycolate oxidase FAD binding subunit
MRPTTAAEVAAVLAQDGPVIPRGGGTKLTWGAPVAGRELDLRGLDAVVAIEPGDFVCVAQAGMRLADLQAALAGTGQRLMLDPPHGEEATLGGIVAANASGPLRHRYGAPRDLVIGARFVLADGTIAKTGGRVVKNVAGYDLARLLCGSLGTIAVITELAFRLHPVAEATGTVVLETGDAAATAAFVHAVRLAPVTPEVVEVGWPTGTTAIRFASTAEGVAAMATATAALAANARVAADPTATISRSPWEGDGAVVGVGIPLPRLEELLRLVARHDGRLALRAGIGVGEARVPPAALSAFADGVRALGGHVAPRRDAPLPTVHDPVALDLMRAVKRRLDPAGTLAPGRLWSVA